MVADLTFVHIPCVRTRDFPSKHLVEEKCTEGSGYLRFLSPSVSSRVHITHGRL